MNKEQLMQFAEHGVRERLRVIQAELNELARLFPHIVKHQDGSMPSVVPVQHKVPPGAVNGRAPTVAFAERQEHVRVYLAKHPGATTTDIATATGMSPNRALSVLHTLAATQSSRHNGGGGRYPSTWVLGGKPTKSVPKFKDRSAAVKAHWASLSPKERAKKQKKLADARRK